MPNACVEPGREAHPPAGRCCGRLPGEVRDPRDPPSRSPRPPAALPGRPQLSCAGHGAPCSASWAASPALSTGRAVPGDKSASKSIPRARELLGVGASSGISPLSPKPGTHPGGCRGHGGQLGGFFGGYGYSPECAPKRRRKYSPKEGINS